MAIIVSASRRTDIPSFYAGWFFDRLREGSVDVENPYNPHQIRHVSLVPHDVACFVFWTRDARPMLGNLDALDPYAYYFHVTITGYGLPLEPSGPSVKDAVASLKALTARIGGHRVIWRYDPVLIVGKYNAAWHAENFKALAGDIAGSVRHCVISMYDSYRYADARLRKAGFAPSEESGGVSPEPAGSALALVRKLVEIAGQNGLHVALCAEPELSHEIASDRYACIDARIVDALGGQDFSRRKDRNQRPNCQCIESVDIGKYGTCPRGCIYCYAKR